MVQQLTGKEFGAFVKEKRVSAVHFDAKWDISYRQLLRQKMKEADEALSDQVKLGEIDCDRDIELAKSIRLLNIPAVAYYLDGELVAISVGFQQNVRGRLEQLLRGEPISYKDGMDLDHSKVRHS